jgi:MSHA biogenesis protein MshK
VVKHLKIMCADTLGRYGLLSLALIATPAVFAESLADPTRPPASLAAPQGNASVPVGGPILQSVLISPGRMVAIISGQTVKLDEKFGEATVIKIAENEVVLRNGKDLQTLKLFPGVEKRVASGRVATHLNRGRQ